MFSSFAGERNVSRIRVVNPKHFFLGKSRGKKSLVIKERKERERERERCARKEEGLAVPPLLRLLILRVVAKRRRRKL
jgi:hypothetical protein